MSFSYVAGDKTGLIVCQGKCPVAFHYSCAKSDEHVKAEIWQVEEMRPAALPADAPEGTQPELEKVLNLKLELLCQAHNPVGI